MKHKSAIAAFLLLSATLPAAGRDWTLVDIGTLGGAGSFATAVSNAGHVVGCSEVAAGGIRAFLYQDGTLRELPIPGAAGDSCALAVNSDGVAAGRAPGGELVVWRGAALTRLGVSGDVGGINDRGVVVGTYRVNGLEQAFAYTGSDVVPLVADGTPSAAKAINARGQIVGTANGRAFLYEGGALRDLGTLGGNNSMARDINERGEVVGMASNAFGQPTPFLYDGTMRALEGPGFSSAVGISNSRFIVGSAEGIGGYLFERSGITRLEALPAVVAKGWRRLEPTGVNDRGWVVGTALTPEGDFRAFLLVPQEGKARAKGG